MIKILILCTGNASRSQMAEGLLKSFDPDLAVFSAGTHPAGFVHPLAVAVMKEAGIDISSRTPKNVDVFVNEPFDYLITVCDNAREACPVFTGKVGRKVHMGFTDPGLVEGSEAERIAAFRHTRDRIRETFFEFYEKELTK